MKSQCINTDLRVGNRRNVAADSSTVRRHLAHYHAKAYHKWCRDNDFVSMLKVDIDQRKNESQQATLDAHTVPVVRMTTTPYTAENFGRVVTKWIICTDQV